MRKEKRNALTREIWRQRLGAMTWWYAIGLIGLFSVLAYMYDPPVPVGHERGKILNQRYHQSKFRGTIPYLVVERLDGTIATVQTTGSRLYENGQELCLIVATGRLFWRLSTALADEKECSP